MLQASTASQGRTFARLVTRVGTAVPPDNSRALAVVRALLATTVPPSRSAPPPSHALLVRHAYSPLPVSASGLSGTSATAEIDLSSLWLPTRYRWFRNGQVIFARMHLVRVP